VQKLWDALPEWEELDSEVALAGYPIPDRITVQAQEKLVPDDMMHTIIGRPELAVFAAKLSFVRRQMEHVRGITQAAWVNGKGNKEKGGGQDMKIGKFVRDFGGEHGAD
jgi:hypothetical protein